MVKKSHICKFCNFNIFFHDSRLYITVGNKMKQYFIISLFRTEIFSPLTQFLNKMTPIQFPAFHLFVFFHLYLMLTNNLSSKILSSFLVSNLGIHGDRDLWRGAMFYK